MTQDLRADGAYVNYVTGAGSAADPSQNLRIATTAELQPDAIDTLCISEWGCELFVSELPAEATRAGFDLQNLTARDGADLPEDAARQIQDVLDDLGALSKLREGARLARQYGGAALIPWLNDGRKASEPLNLEAPKLELLRLEVRDRHDIETPTEADLEDDPRDRNYGMPRVWRLIQKNGLLNGGASTEVHHSRLWRWTGWKPDKQSRQTPHEWGRSVLEGFEPAWSRYRHAEGEAVAAAARLAETRVGIPDLMEILAGSDASRKEGHRRYAGEVAAMRSALRLFMHDDKETIEDAAVDVQGAVRLIELLREGVAGASGMSIQKFFRLQQEGLSNNDKSGEARDTAAVVAFQRDHILPALDWLTEIVIAHLKLPVESWQWSPKPLYPESSKERADRQLVEAQRDRIYANEIGAVHDNEVREGMKKGDLPYVYDEAYDEERGEPIEPGMLPPEPGAEGGESEEDDRPETRAA